MKYIINHLLLLYFITEVRTIYPPWIAVFSTNHHAPWYNDYFCKDTRDLVLNYAENTRHYYDVWINEILDAGTEVRVQFDAEASVVLVSNQTVY